LAKIRVPRCHRTDKQIEQNFAQDLFWLDYRPLGSYLAVNTREAKMDRDDPKIGRSNVENLAFHFLRPIRFGKGRPLAWATLLNQKLKVREGAHWAKYPRCSRRHSWILRRFSTPILIYGRK
jgi:hypothetical protein